MPSRLRLALLNPLKVKSSRHEVAIVGTKMMKKKKKRKKKVFEKLDDILAMIAGMKPLKVSRFDLLNTLYSKFKLNI